MTGPSRVVHTSSAVGGHSTSQFGGTDGGGDLCTIFDIYFVWVYFSRCFIEEVNMDAF